MKRVLDFGRGTVAVGLHMTQAVLMAVYAVVAMLCRLLGARPPAPPQLPMPQVSPSAVLDRYESALGAAINRQHGPVHEAGAAAHQYALATDPSVRSAVDLTGLTPDQFAWLMSLSDDDLQRLAAAGPLACQRAVSGKRSGIVGLPEMRLQVAPGPVIVDPRDHVREALRGRVRGERGGRIVAAAA